MQDDQKLLLSACQMLAAQPESTGLNVCAYYIQGFLAGARSTITVTTTSPGESIDQWSSFAERAYRTRVSSLSDSRQATAVNKFCLPDDESLDQVIEVLLKSMSSPVETIDILKARFVHVLKAKYPCG